MLKTIIAGLMVVGVSAVAENRTEQSPLTMEQLMRELRIQGGNFNFTFDQLVFARVTTEVTDLSDPAKKEVKHFDTASANKTAPSSSPPPRCLSATIRRKWTNEK